EVWPEARLSGAYDALGGCTRSSDTDRGRLQHRAARVRRLQPQGPAQGGQSYADGMRGARPLSRRAWVERPRARAHSCTAAQLFAVELPGRLAAEGPGPEARSHVGVARPRAGSEVPPRDRGDPQVGTTFRSRAAGNGVRPLTGDAPSDRYSPSRRVAQAVDALRHGWPLALGGAPVLLPVETAPGEAHSSLALISTARAGTLKLANQRAAADPHSPVLVRGAEPLDLAAARILADPSLDLAA